MLRSAINDLNLDQFLPMLSVIDQDEHISAIPHPDCDHPMFYWIFRNKDFSQWSSAECSRVLWLSGLPERNIDQVSSYVVHQEKETALETDCFVLYFFCSSAIRRRSSVTDFVHTLLKSLSIVHQWIRGYQSSEISYIVFLIVFLCRLLK